MMNQRIASRLFAVALAGAVSASLPAAAQPMERARAAQARGDLRTAQIELRNVVRDNPRSADARMALALASLDLDDGTTAEKEARAALEFGADPVAGTALVLRAMLASGKHEELLREFTMPSEPSPVAGQVAAARALAELSLKRPEAAAASVEAALRIAPNAVEPHLAAAALAGQRGDWAASEAAVDRALAIDPNVTEGLLRKASLLFRRNKPQEAAETFGRVLARSPGNVPARLGRAEAMLRSGDAEVAVRDVEAALVTMPGNVPGTYLRAVLRARAGNWQGANEDLQRIGPQLAGFPDGYLVLAVTRRALGQAAGAEDAARRYVARRPEDPRGVKLLAMMELEGKQPEAAAATLTRLVARGEVRDAEIYDLLGRAKAGAGRPREALEALTKAAALAPDNPEILSRLAAARLNAGDTAGAEEAGKQSLQLRPAQPRVHELLAVTALLRGDTAGATAELGRVDPAQRGEVGGIATGLLHLTQIDFAAARAAFAAVLRNHPDSALARIGLARVAAFDGKMEEAEKLLGEVLRRDPANAEALARLAAMAQPGSPRAAEARAVLEAAQAASPEEPALAMALAAVQVRAGAAAEAAALLDSPALRQRGSAAALQVALARSEALAAAERWDDARGAARAALAEDPSSIPARLLLAGLVARNGDMQTAESLVQEGLRATPGDGRLQGALVGMVLKARGLDAALAVADWLAAQLDAQPAAATLRADALAAAGKKEDAIHAYAAAAEAAPSRTLALRGATLLYGSGKPAEAAAVLRTWLQRSPEDVDALMMLAAFDIDAGRLAEAETHLTAVVERRPNDSSALNNLAWVLDRRGGPNAPRARALAERAYALNPNADTSDTLGWILARAGEPRLGVSLLRQSVQARNAAKRPDPAASWRLAYALHGVGEKAEAERVLTEALAGNAAFPERAEAERLLAELRAGR